MQPPPEPESSAPAEYNGERDMDAFWETVKLEREPMKVRWYPPAILVLALFSVPWYFPEGHLGRVLGGLPVWIWISLACAAAMSCITAIAVLRHWSDGQDPD